MNTNPSLNMPCLLQPADNDYVCVEATENDQGLDLHHGLFGPDDDLLADPPDYQYWGRLSLEGWHTLAEIYALRHPATFAKIVRRWHALQEATRHAPPP